MTNIIGAPRILSGNAHTDDRGIINFNNDFNTSCAKRIYTIENKDISLKRGWQGHKVEQRWFSAIVGSFKVRVRLVVDLEGGNYNGNEFVFILNDEKLDYLHAPGGYATIIQALKPGSKLLVLADYMIGEVQDEWRFNIK